MHPQSPPLALYRIVLNDSVDFDIVGVTFDASMTFDKHLRSPALVS